MSISRTQAAVAVQPWYGDHRFEGRIVLPAVETMLLLAERIGGLYPETDIRIMEDVCFRTFLEIPAGAARLEVLVEDERREEGSILARLLSRVQLKAMTRLKEHGEIVFPVRKGGRFPDETALRHASGTVMEIDVDTIYRELVPFGPAYRTLREAVSLAGECASGKVRAPELPIADGVREILGSPFPLDGAFHAACVLGQRFVDFVPFPVGFSRRTVARPTRPGGSYMVRVLLMALNRDELVFDLDIVDDRDRIHETVRGLRMRDVSGGRVGPPDWIRTGRAN